MEMAEKEGGLPVFDTNILIFIYLFFFFFFYQLLKLLPRLTGKIGANLPTTPGVVKKIQVISREWKF